MSFSKFTFIVIKNGKEKKDPEICIQNIRLLNYRMLGYQWRKLDYRHYGQHYLQFPIYFNKENTSSLEVKQHKTYPHTPQKLLRLLDHQHQELSILDIYVHNFHD